MESKSDPTDEELELFARLDLSASAADLRDLWSPLDEGRKLAPQRAGGDVTVEGAYDMAEAMMEELAINLLDPDQLRTYLGSTIVNWQVGRALAATCKQREHVEAHFDGAAAHVIHILNVLAHEIGVRDAK